MPEPHGDAFCFRCFDRWQKITITGNDDRMVNLVFAAEKREVQAQHEVCSLLLVNRLALSIEAPERKPALSHLEATKPVTAHHETAWRQRIDRSRPALESYFDKEGSCSSTFSADRPAPSSMTALPA